MTLKRIAAIEVIDPGSAPDVDSDFNTEAREHAIKYVTDQYGNVASIITFNTMAAKKAFKSMCTIYEVPFAQATKIASLIPGPIEGVDCTLNELFDPNAERFSEGVDFRNATAGNEWDKIIKGAIAIEGRNDSSGVHPCGLVISQKPLDGVIPTHVRDSDGAIISQWTYGQLESIGLIKMDFLGLDTVDLIQHAVENIKDSDKETPNMQEIIHGEMDDAKTFEMISKGETTGIFQLAGDGVRDLLRRMKPTAIDDIIATTALYRPGPMGMQSHLKYADRKNGRETYEYPIHPEFKGSPLENILEKTEGLIVYQESILQIASEIGGMTLQEGDDLRKAMGKKKKDVMAKMQPVFIRGGIEKGYSEEALNELWNTMAVFAEYGFNKCLHGRTLVATPEGKRTIKELFDELQADQLKNIEVYSMFEDGSFKLHKVNDIVKSGRKPLFTVRTESGKRIRITDEHRMLTTDGYKTIVDGGLKVGAELIHDETWEKESSRTIEAEFEHKSYKKIEANFSGSRNLSEWRISDGRWCNSLGEALAAEYLLTRGVEFELHKRIAGENFTRVSDFYANGIYFEFDGLDRGREYFEVQKYGNDIPFVYMTPSNYKDVIDEALIQHHGLNGDKIIAIIKPKRTASGEYYTEMTYDIEMEDFGPSNFLADGFVSHNSHSVAYGINAYQSAYLKANYPVEFMAALIDQKVDNREKTLAHLQEARRMGLKVGPVDANESKVKVSPVYNGKFDIVFGFSGVSSVSKENAEIIVNERKTNGPFADPQDFVKRCYNAGIANKRIFENLTLAGAFDDMGYSRKAVVDAIPKMINNAKTTNVRGASLFSMFGNAEENNATKIEFSNEKYSYVDMLKKEANSIGLYLSGHPLSNIGKRVGGTTKLSDLHKLQQGSQKFIMGAVTDIETKINRRGGKSINLTIDDGTDYLTARLDQKLIKAIDKKAAQEKIELLYRKGEVGISDDLVKAATNADIDLPIDAIEKNDVYLMVVTYRPARGELTYGARLDFIVPLRLTRAGDLPVRVRISKKAKVKKVAEAFAKKHPGDSEIWTVETDLDNLGVTVPNDQMFITAANIMKKDEENGVVQATKKAVESDSKKIKGLDGSSQNVKKSKNKGGVKADEDVRPWPPTGIKNLTAFKPIDHTILSARRALELLPYENSGLTCEKVAALAQYKSVPNETVDFGVLDDNKIEQALGND